MTSVDAVIYMTAADIAQRDGVSRQAISKQVARLVERHGLEVRRDHNARIVGVNIVDFDRLMHRYGDSAKARQPEAIAPAQRGAPDVSGEGTLDAARIRKLQLDTELQRLNLHEQRGLLVRHDLIGESLQRLAEELTRCLDLTQHTDAIAAAFSRGGLHGLRIELKTITARTRTDMADHCAAIALAAPSVDPALGADQIATETVPG